MVNYLKLVRYQNLLLIALLQVIVHYGFLRFQSPVLALDHLHFAVFVFSCLCIAAGGYVVNNIEDVDSDLENKPENVVVGNGISEAAAYNLYYGLTLTGLGLAYYLSNHIGHWNYVIFFALVAFSLFLYATSFKGQLFIGNLIIAAVCATSVILVGIFDLIPVVYPDNRSLLYLLFDILLDYSIFTFLLTFLREIVKDLEDVDGDYNQGLNTLPIALGRERTAKICSVFGIGLALLLGWYLYTYMFHLVYLMIFALVTIIAPLLFVSIQIWSATKKSQYYNCGQILKWIIFFGMLSLGLLTLNMNIHAS